MTAHFPRGAEWRVWDLQVHTPFSELNNGFGSDPEAYARTFFLQAIAHNVAVVGVTDYFVVEGYRYLSELQKDDERLAILIGIENVAAAKQIQLFANVELRCDIFVNGSRVNYHVIFSNELSADDIENHFLHQLQITTEGSPGDVDQKYSLTKSNLELFGAKVRNEHDSFQKQTDTFVGMAQASISATSVMDVLLSRSKIFGGRYVFCVPCDEDLSKISWDGQGHVTRKVLMQKSHMFFSSNAGTRDFALGRKHPSPEAFIKEFGSFKPCVHSSDAHEPSELFAPDNERLTWIKADPTFKGLLQVINEPDSRVYIGKFPPNLESINQRPTKVIRSVSVHKKTGASFSEKWFDHEILLNSQLVAIIGNKGSGKSALADILGLLGNTPRYESFSFLSPERFKERKSNKAKHFEASLTWADDKIDGPVSLDDMPSPGSVETVKYIPQDYLEKICNEVSLGNGSKFYAELQNVIFSHVSIAEQLGFSSLDDLLNHRSSETKRTIDFLIDQLRAINREIVSCEDQLTDAHRKSLEAQLAAKQREIDAHDQARPQIPTISVDDAAASDLSLAVNSQMKELQANLLSTEGLIQSSKIELNGVTKRRSFAEMVLGKLSNLEKQIASAEEETRSDMAELGLKWPELVSVSIKKELVQSVITECTRLILALNARLAGTDGGLVEKQSLIKNQIEQLAQKLSEPERAFEEAKARLKAWQDVRTTLEGSVDQIGSLKQIKSALASLPEIQERRVELGKSRLSKTQEIYKEKERLRDDYGRYYGAVQNFLTAHPIAQGQQFKLTFNVAIAENGFSNGLLRLLNQRRAGTFSGVEEGSARLKQYVESTDFNSAAEIRRFLLMLMRALRQDQRPGKDEAPTELKIQLAQGVTVQDLYDFIFSLDYLDPIYSLQWDGKSLEQLSPGERGNLLLIFYLLIDRDNIPLVIDQPEENLDNHTVYRTLVPCVKEAKLRRQIIIVTHNPNLAVVCDAEQVICAEIKKDQGNEVRYVSGSIEDPLINRKIVDILEGTRPAFNKRDAKYIAGESIAIP